MVHIPEHIIGQSPEQRQAAFQAAGVPLITSESIAPITSLDVKTPQPAPSFPVKDLEVPELKPTEPEIQVSDLTKQITELQERTLGETAFREARKGEFGVAEKEKTLEDLAGRLRDLQIKSKIFEVSPEFEQRATLAPFAEGERARAQRSVAVEALTTSALIDAANRNLLRAEKKVEEAVRNKFDPLKEEIAVKRSNLDLIIQSPEYSLADKNRALKQKALIDRQEKEIEKQESAEKAKRKIAVEVAATGRADSLMLDKITNAKDDIEAARLAAPFLGEEVKDADIRGFEEAKRRGIISKDTNFFDYLRRKAGAERAPTVGETPVSLTPEDKRNLLGSGLNEADIKNIENDIRIGGIDKVLKGLDNESQKAAVRKIYGVEFKVITRPKLLDVARQMKPADIENFLRSRFTEDQLKTFADQAGISGFFTRKKTGIANYIASPLARQKVADLLEEQYKQTGYTIQ